MKRLFIFGLIFMLVVTGRGNTIVDFLLTDARLGIGQATNRTVYVQPMSMPTTTSTSVVLGTRLTFLTDTNGEFILTNAMSGLYACSVQAPPSRQDFTIYITSTNLGTIYAADCLVANSSSTFPAGQVAWAASVTDNRYARTSNNLANYATLFQVTNIVGNFAATLGTIVYSNATDFYLNSNPSNYVDATVTNGLAATVALTAQGTALTNTITNLLAIQGILWTNAISTEGNSATNYANGIGLAATNYSALLGTSVTNFILATSNSLATAFGNSANYQPASTTLTNWSLHSTNSFVDTNTFITFTNTLGTSALKPVSFFQTASSVLDDYISQGTNFWYPRSNPSNFVTLSTGNTLYYSISNPSNFVSATVTNGLATIAYVDSVSNSIVSGTGFQPASQNLTNWSSQPTNSYMATNAALALFQQVPGNTNAFVAKTNGTAFNLTAVASDDGIYSFRSTGTAFFGGGNGTGTGNTSAIFSNSTATGFPSLRVYNGANLRGSATSGLVLQNESGLNALNFLSNSMTVTLPTVTDFDYVYVGSGVSTISMDRVTKADFTTAISSFITNITTIYATNNPSNIVVTLPSTAFWTNGEEWRCVSGSNWFQTVLP